MVQNLNLSGGAPLFIMCLCLLSKKCVLPGSTWFLSLLVGKAISTLVVLTITLEFNVLH